MHSLTTADVDGNSEDTQLPITSLCHPSPLQIGPRFPFLSLLAREKFQFPYHSANFWETQVVTIVALHHYFTGQPPAIIILLYIEISGPPGPLLLEDPGRRWLRYCTPPPPSPLVTYNPEGLRLGTGILERLGHLEVALLAGMVEGRFTIL